MNRLGLQNIPPAACLVNLQEQAGMIPFHQTLGARDTGGTGAWRYEMGVVPQLALESYCRESRSQRDRRYGFLKRHDLSKTDPFSEVAVAGAT
jgi:hypothetical protein